MSEPASGFLDALAALSEAGVAYVIVGVGGTNFYGRALARGLAVVEVRELPGQRGLAPRRRQVAGLLLPKP